MDSGDLVAGKEAIREHVAALEAALNHKDIDAVLALLVDNFVFVSRAGSVEGKTAARGILAASMRRYVSARHIVERIEVATSGDVAWLVGYELSVRERPEGTVETKDPYLITFRKEAGVWKEAAICFA
jgi:ketosteroid isomerase-like protein